ncbi:MAG TPA: GNAT family N-acetyltransferase [Caulobacteraceae bacterium]|nr:GNAT family N-acetyltransferase [Caulobacteraceae bacterium]
MSTDIDTLRREAETPVFATAADADAVAGDLCDAFADDVMFDWFLRDDARRDAVRARFFRFLIGKMAFGSGALVERPASGGAAAVWLPFEAAGPNGLGTLIRAAPTMLAATGLSRILRLMAVMEDMDRHHPMERRHAYLWFLGVARRAQGRGIGSRLLAVGTARLDAEDLPAYLETQTERNLALYQRFGFEIISKHHPRKDSPPLWSMWREPGAGRHA